MNEVLNAKPADFDSISAKYLDAAFAIIIHDEMVCNIRGVRILFRKRTVPSWTVETWRMLDFGMQGKWMNTSVSRPGMTDMDYRNRLYYIAVQSWTASFGIF